MINKHTLVFHELSLLIPVSQFKPYDFVNSSYVDSDTHPQHIFLSGSIATGAFSNIQVNVPSEPKRQYIIFFILYKYCYSQLKCKYQK